MTPASASQSAPLGMSPQGRRLDLALAFLLGGGVCLLAHAAWHRWAERRQPTTPLVLAIVDINTADEVALAQLPGVGPRRAADIVAYRQHHGPFSSVDDLLAVPGIGPVTLARLRPAVCVSGLTAPALLGREKAPSPPRKTADRDVTGGLKRAGVPDDPVNLNTASVEQLQQLPGIGPVLAQRIVAERERTGPFRQVDDLRRIRGIKDKTIDKIRSLVTCGGGANIAGRSP
jgi:competence protein ComEA